MKNQTACFTGHRYIPDGQVDLLRERLAMAVGGLIERGYRYFGAGGALGFDTMAALTTLSMKSQYLQIRLILVIPCITQADAWRAADRILYEQIKARADKVVVLQRDYTRDCMFRRNRHLVDHSSACICYLTRTTGGTAYTVGYARRRGLKILNIA